MTDRPLTPKQALTFADLTQVANRAPRERSLSFPVPGATEIDGILLCDYTWETVVGPEAFAKAIAERADVRRFEHTDCPAREIATWQGGDGKACPFCGEAG